MLVRATWRLSRKLTSKEAEFMNLILLPMNILDTWDLSELSFEMWQAGFP